MPVIGGLLLVGCGDPAADDACAELQDYEATVIETDEEDTNEVLTDIYADVSELADRTDGELGDALTDLQPLLQQLEALTGEDEDAAAGAQESVSALSEEEIQDIDEAASYVNETCDLSVLL